MRVGILTILWVCAVLPSAVSASGNDAALERLDHKEHSCLTDPVGDQLAGDATQTEERVDPYRTPEAVEMEQLLLSLAMNQEESQAFDASVSGMLESVLKLYPGDDAHLISLAKHQSGEFESDLPEMDKRPEVTSSEDLVNVFADAMGDDAAVFGNLQYVSLQAYKQHVQNRLRDLTPIAKTVVLVRLLAKRKVIPVENALVNTWLLKHKNLSELIQSYNVPRVIAVSCPNKYYTQVVHQIRCIREVFKSNIPIEVYYIGSADLSENRVAKLKQMPGVSVIDITTVFNNAQLGLGGWAAKPFVMLASSGREVLLLDADAVLGKAPETFFDYVPYRRTGVLYFYDRFINNRPGFKQWLEGILPGVNKNVIAQNPMAAGQTAYLQEAGAVLIRKHGASFWGLLIASLLNARRHREELYSKTHGDKEAYWIGTTAMNAPIAWGPQPAGQCGQSADANQWQATQHGHFYGRLCHNLAHFDADMRLWWMNDGMLVDKHNDHSNIRYPRHGAVAREAKWDGLCLKGTIRHLPPDQVDLLRRMGNMYNSNV